MALLDGPTVDDGTACEIGLFHGLALSDPRKKGTVGLLTDFRSAGGGRRLNLFVQGCVQESGAVVDSIDEVLGLLERWRDELERAA